MKSHIVKKPYLIAEIAQTHDGSVGLAHSFVSAVAKYGAHAVKFQMHIADQESSVDDSFRSGTHFYDKSRYEYWKRMEFDKETWLSLKKQSESLGLDFILSVFSVKALNLAIEIGVKKIKLGSGELYNTLLINALSEFTNLDLFISSGLSTMDEIIEVIEKFKEKSNNITLFQCTSGYPVSFKQIGLNVISEFQKYFKGLDFGLSDHSGSVYPSLAAYSEGASVFELHVTMHKEMYGPDVSSSITLEDLRMLRNGVDIFFEMYSNPVDKSKIQKSQKSLKSLFSKSFHYSSDLEVGHTLTSTDLILLKPNIGISYDRVSDLIGKTLTKNVLKNQRITWEDLTG